MKQLLLIILIPFFVACTNNEPEYSLNKYYVSMATVENPNLETAFFMHLDDNSQLWVVATNFRYYRPKNGQRIIANYSILSNKPDTAVYDHDIKLNDVYEVLTKGIFNISPETEDSIGNDYISIKDIWVGSHFLNVEFNYPGGNKIHYINLVSDSTKTYNDGKIHLEFRHNANGDYPNYNRWGMVSFDLKSLETTTSDKVELVIHTKEFGDKAKTYALTYKYGSLASPRTTHDIKIGDVKAVMQ